ncbi:MAG: hypothetical protein MJ097_02420 [Dorea sp.]|nr:hypothetical protein [Dorea sp.]
MNEVGYRYNYEKERREAVDAGERALESLYAARKELNSARNWGLFDLFGGGMISSLIKHSKMENAQACLERAKRDLCKFSKELRDVNTYEGIDIQTGDFLTFADFFFDGFVADFLVQSKINKARTQIDDAIVRIEDILNQLTAGY